MTKYAIVPVEPTPEMLEAQFGVQGIAECYKAMIAAAPQSNITQEETDHAIEFRVLKPLHPDYEGDEQAFEGDGCVVTVKPDPSDADRYEAHVRMEREAHATGKTFPFTEPKEYVEINWDEAIQKSAEQQAREMLERMGFDARYCSAGNLVELANLIAGQAPRAIIVDPAKLGMTPEELARIFNEHVRDRPVMMLHTEYEQIGVIRPDGEFTTAEGVDGEPVYVRRDPNSALTIKEPNWNSGPLRPLGMLVYSPTGKIEPQYTHFELHVDDIRAGLEKHFVQRDTIDSMMRDMQEARIERINREPLKEGECAMFADGTFKISVSSPLKKDNLPERIGSKDDLARVVRAFTRDYVIDELNVAHHHIRVPASVIEPLKNAIEPRRTLGHRIDIEPDK